MLPSHTELRANAARVRRARKTQAIVTDRASHHYVRNSSSRITGIGIVGTAGGYVAIEHAGWATGIIVTDLGPQWVRKEERQRETAQEKANVSTTAA
jgi:hypothetical protein